MYKLGHLESNGQNQDVSQCNNRDVFAGHNMNNASCSLSSPPSDPTPKSTTTSVLRRWRRPEPHDSGSKHVQPKDAAASQPSKFVNATPASDTDKQMNQVGNYVGSAETSAANTGTDYSMFVPQLSPLVPQSTARPYDSTKYLPHVQYSENGGYARTSPVVPTQNKVPDKSGTATGQSSYYHQDSTTQEVHFRSPSYPIQNTPPLAHSASQKCILPNENTTYSVANQKVVRDYGYPHRDYSVVAHNYSPQKINPTESKISPQGVTDDPSYCLNKSGGYVQDNRISPQNMTLNYPLQNAMDRRVSPHNPKSPIYRNYPQNNGSAVIDSRMNISAQNYVPSTKSSGEYMAQNTNYYMEKPPCVSQKQGYSPEKPIIDARYVHNYNPNYVVSKNSMVSPQDPKHARDYRNVISSSKKASPPFPILEQRLNQADPNYCSEYSTQGYYPSKYGPVVLSRTSISPKMARDGSVAGHNYISPNVHHNPKIPSQDVMMPPNYSIPNKYYHQNQGQEWKMSKEYEQNLYLTQMNQMHARLPHNMINKSTDLPRDLSYVDQNQRMVQKGRMYCPETNLVDHLQYNGKSVVPVTQKSPKMVGYNITDQRTVDNHLPNDYINASRPCGTVMKSTDYQRSSKVAEYGPVIQSVKAAELGYDPKLSRDYLMHQQACRNEIPSDQQNFVCSPPLMAQNSRNPPPYPVGYPRQSNIKMNEMPARNISPRRTFQENMPVVVFSPQHIGLPKTSPNQMYSPEYSNSQHYPGYYTRESIYPGHGVKPGMQQYPVDQSGKYLNVHANRNNPQHRFQFGYPEHQYYQHKHPESADKLNFLQSNIFRTHYNPHLPEHLQQNVARGFEGDFRNTGASNYSDFEMNRAEDRAVFSKKECDIGKSLKEFLESWEDDDEIVANLPDLVLCNNISADKQKLQFAEHSEEASETSKSSSDEDSPKATKVSSGAEQPLYILGSTNISSEALPQYLAVYEQVDKLPDNIKGFYKDSASNGTEEQKSVVAGNTEKPSDDLEVSSEPQSIIRESVSPHDLTVTKNKEEEKIDNDEEQVLNLSTNRNKENNEFLVEEYSNASEENNIQVNQEAEKKLPDSSNSEDTKNISKTERNCDEKETNVLEADEDKQGKCIEKTVPEENMNNIQENIERVIEESTENIMEENPESLIEENAESVVEENAESIGDNIESVIEENAENIVDNIDSVIEEHTESVIDENTTNTTKETIQNTEESDEDKPRKLPEGHKCSIVVTLRKKNRSLPVPGNADVEGNNEASDASSGNESSDEEESEDEEQPKITANSTSENSSTTSVIVPNKYFEIATLISRTDLSEKIPILTEDPEELVNGDECNIQPETIEIQIEASQETKSVSSTELIHEASSPTLLENTTVLDEIEENQLPCALSEADMKEREINTNLDISVIDFETSELISQNKENLEIEKSIINATEEIEPISFDNLINSPENIEMKDDESIAGDLENNTDNLIKNEKSYFEDKHFQEEIISSPSIPNSLDLSVSQTLSVTETETLLQDLTENNSGIQEYCELKETEAEKYELPLIDNDSVIITHEENNVDLVDNSEKISEKQAVTRSENIETDTLKEDATLLENKITEVISENIEEKKEEDDSSSSCILPSLSPIPDYDSKEDQVKIELLVIDYPNIKENEATRDQEVTETNNEPIPENTVKNSTEEKLSNEIEFTNDLQNNEEPVEPEKPFESTVDKLVISNVKSIQEDSNDSVTEEESINEAPREESSDILNEQQIKIENLDCEDFKSNEDYAHLIQETEEILIKEEIHSPETNISDIISDSESSNFEKIGNLKQNLITDEEHSKNEVNNFDFSYLESCTDNICEKSEERNENFVNNKINSTINKTQSSTDIANNENLKFILDSSESDSDVSKDNIINKNKITIKSDGTTLQTVSEVVPENNFNEKEENSTTEKLIESNKEIISTPEILESQNVELNPESEKEIEIEAVLKKTIELNYDIHKEKYENIVSENNEVPEIELSVSEPAIPDTEIDQETSEKQVETSFEVPLNNAELSENTAEVTSAEVIVENVGVNLTDSENETIEENIILPEDSECVVIYEEDEQYLIIQPDSDTAEIIPSEEIAIQESEILIPEMSSQEEPQKEEEIIVDVATEPVGEEIIICEEGIEDWVQREEIIESNEEGSTEPKLDETTEESELKEQDLVNEEQTKTEHIKSKEIVIENETKLINNKITLEKKKLVMTKQQQKLQKFKKPRHLGTKQITEIFINEEKKFSYPNSELECNSEEKELLFMNPENPDTIKYDNSSAFLFPDLRSAVKRRVSYGDFSSPKIDFQAPKRRYSSTDNGRSVKKPIINLDEISNNITKVLENLTKHESFQYNANELKEEKKKDVDAKNEQQKRGDEINFELNDATKENKQQIKISNLEEKSSIKSGNKIDVKDMKPIENKIEETIHNSSANTKVSKNLSPSDSVTKLVEKLIKPKLIIPKTNYNLIANNILANKTSSEQVHIGNHPPERKPSPEQVPAFPTRRPSLLKTPENKEDKVVFDSSSPIINTARLTEPIFPKSVVSDVKTTAVKRQNDPRIDRPKEVPEKEEKLSFIENKLSNTFSLTEYTKNYIKMKTGQTVETKNMCGLNGVKGLDPRMTKTEDEVKPPIKVNNTRKKHKNTIEEDNKYNEKKVKINLQDYRNRKQSQSSNDLNVFSSESSSQIEEVTKEDIEEENKVEGKLKSSDKPQHNEPEEKTEQIINVKEKSNKNIPDRKVEKLIIKPKKSLDQPTKDPLLIPELSKVITNINEPKVTNNQLDCKNLDEDNTVSSKSKTDLKQNKPKKRKRRFRNLYTVDEEDEMPTKHLKNSLDAVETKLNGILTSNEDSTSSSKISEDSQQSSANFSASKVNEDSEASSGNNGEFLCCLDLNSNGTNDENCGFKCHIKLNAIGEKIRDYEINKNSCSNPNKLKLTLKPVKKKKPAFSEVLSNLDSLVETEILSKRQKKKLNGKNSDSDKSETNGEGTLWTIKNKIPKVIIKRNGSGYCAVFRDVSSNPLWQPKIRLKRQKYIESLVLRSNVKF